MNLNCDLDKVKYFGNTAQLRYYLAVEVWLGKLLKFDMFFFNKKKNKKNSYQQQSDELDIHG